MSTVTVSGPGSVSVQEVTVAGPAPSPVRQAGGDPPVATAVPATTLPAATLSVAPAPVRQAGGERPVTSSVPSTDMARTARRSVNARMVRKGICYLLYLE